MGWVVSTIEPIAAYGMGAVTLLGVILGCLVVLTLAAGITAWRYFNPLIQAASQIVASLPAPSNNTEMLDVKDAVGAPEFDKIWREIARIDSVDERLAGSLNRLREEFDDVKSEVGAAVSLSEGSRASIIAIYIREDLNKRSKLIHQMAASLTKEEEYQFKSINWSEWMGQEILFRSHLRSWCRDAMRYGASFDRVMGVREAQMLGEWSFDEKWLPSFDAIHKYKSFRIVYTNFIEEENRVSSRIMGVIWSGD